MSFQQFKVGHRLGLGFLSVLVLLLAVTALGWSGLRATQAATERVIQLERLASVTEEWAASTTLNISRALAVAKSRADPEVDAYFKPLIAQTSTRISELQQTLEAEISSAEGKALLAKISTARGEYIAVRKTFFDALKTGDLVAANQILTSQVLPAADRYSGAQNEMLAAQRSLVQAAMTDSAHTVSRNVTWLVTLAAIAVVVASLLAWRITRSVTVPVHQAVAIASAVADGNLSVVVQTERKDELGDLLNALGAMKNSLIHTVGQ
ncbi:MAG: MCP four helix bundle domain-containing protein, partial [Hydrogenophaga sp.]|uniref:MCP four helix bundle domain-containing protein n=1 Tax=Hydrogenophaga sp. TaxID=1904254 RepID=UPI00261070A6